MTKPALTAEEWKLWLGSDWVNQPTFLGAVHHGRGGKGAAHLYASDWYGHAEAALGLHEQPFGFTREMLLAIRDGVNFAESFEHHTMSADECDQQDRSVELGRLVADRIEALLPPDKPTEST